MLAPLYAWLVEHLVSFSLLQKYGMSRRIPRKKAQLRFCYAVETWGGGRGASGYPGPLIRIFFSLYILFFNAQISVF